MSFRSRLPAAALIVFILACTKQDQSSGTPADSTAAGAVAQGAATDSTPATEGVAQEASAAPMPATDSVDTPPPPLETYDQPAVPGPNYIWTPGYWAWGQDGYFWVPGTWVLPPAPGQLWTPGYWGANGAAYVWHPGYWATSVGFYGGINYGHGYFGRSYVGGRWSGGQFRYNTAVTNVNTTIVHNVYVDKTVIVNNNTTVNRVSYNGGRGGIAARPSAADLTLRQKGRPMTAVQTQHEHAATQDRNQLVSVNHSHPKQLAVSHPLTAQNHPASSAPLRSADRVARPAQAKPVQPKPAHSASRPAVPSHTTAAKQPTKQPKQSTKKPVTKPEKEQPQP